MRGGDEEVHFPAVRGAAARLAELAKREGSSKAARQALARSLEGDVGRGEGVSSSQPADALDNRLERIEQGLKTLSEVTALHARYYLGRRVLTRRDIARRVNAARRVLRSLRNR
jgi:hypothetical protein